MLRTPAPFPQVGSYGLFTDADLPIAQQRAELVRILRLAGTMAFIAFPLRAGASGNSLVPLTEIIDATPLTKAEEREFTDLDRALHGRTRPKPTKAARHHALRERAIWSLILNSELAKMHALQAREGRAAREAA